MFLVMQDTTMTRSPGSPADTTDVAVHEAAPGVALGAAAPIDVSVNGEARQTSAVTLLALLAELGHGINRVATAVNGEFVPERLRGDRRLAAGDAIEIVAPRQGG